MNQSGLSGVNAVEQLRMWANSQGCVHPVSNHSAKRMQVVTGWLSALSTTSYSTRDMIDSTDRLVWPSRMEVYTTKRDHQMKKFRLRGTPRESRYSEKPQRTKCRTHRCGGSGYGRYCTKHTPTTGAGLLTCSRCGKPYSKHQLGVWCQPS